MDDAISYTRMRRLLGLPDVARRTPAPWAVRKIHSGDDAGLWGVWQLSDAPASGQTLVEACTTWREAMDHVGH